ncbi:unnamed protein product [Boreogadus saida]
MPNEDDPRLTMANNTIANLKKDIRRLSDELHNKESLLASVMDLAADQSKQIASLSAAFQDTVVWDPLTSTCHRPSSCSTPNRQPSWTEVVIRGCKSGPDGAPTPPLVLSNQYAALSGDSPAPSADAPAVPARSKVDRSQSSTPAALQPLVANNAAGSRHRILREAVLRRSGVLPRPQPVISAPRADIAAPRPLSPVGPCSVDTAIPLSGSEIPRPSAPRPLVLPTTLIVGDSIIRNTRFFNAATHSFHGATVPVIISKLPGLLRSLPSSIRRVIVHVGTYDTAHHRYPRQFPLPVTSVADTRTGKPSYTIHHYTGGSGSFSHYFHL